MQFRSRRATFVEQNAKRKFGDKESCKFERRRAKLSLRKKKSFREEARRLI